MENKLAAINVANETVKIIIKIIKEFAEKVNMPYEDLMGEVVNQIGASLEKKQDSN